MLEGMEIDDKNIQFDENDELKDSLKELEDFIEMVSKKVENRKFVMLKLRDIINPFWSEMIDVNKAVMNIQVI